MADNEQNIPEPSAQNAAQQQQPNFLLQRIYLKDSSFESPGSPGAFQSQQWRPRITFDIKSRSNKLADEVYEVVLVLTMEARQEEVAAFLVEVQQAGIFICKAMSDETLEMVLATMCPNILFPYARESIDNLVVRGSYPPLMLSPVNFEALYMQRKQQEAQRAQQAGGNGAGNQEEKPAN